MYNSEEYIEAILDIGTSMIRSGAETHCVEDSLYRMFDSCGFIRSEVWAIPSCIQASVTDPDGNTVTRMRHIRETGIDFTQLEEMNDISERMCSSPSDGMEAYNTFRQTKPVVQRRWYMTYITAALGLAGFGIFFKCDAADILVVAVVSILIPLLSAVLSRRESNPLIMNFLLSFAVELVIMGLYGIGLCHHPDYITITVIMFLVGTLGVTNGLGDLVHLDTISGIVRLTVSFTGSLGIALGIALSLRLLKIDSYMDTVSLNPSLSLQLAACFAGCIGFSMWLCVRKKYIIFCALGALFTWLIYLLISDHFDLFLSVISASMICALYAEVMARIKKCPAIIIRTVAILPLLPGTDLYFMMNGIVMGDTALYSAKAENLLFTCLGIALGFMAVETAAGLLKNSGKRR